MKIRNGFVSNSSSSSFIIIYKNLMKSDNYFYTRKEYQDEIKKLLQEVEDEYIDHDNFAFVFKHGSSGDCESMLVQPDKEIKDYIKSKKLFTTNKRFISMLESIILVEKLILKETEPTTVRLYGNTVKDYKDILNYIGDVNESYTIDFDKNFDYSSIMKEDLKKLDKFIKQLNYCDIFNPDYQRFGDLSEAKFNCMDEVFKEFTLEAYLGEESED